MSSISRELPASSRILNGGTSGCRDDIGTATLHRAQCFGASCGYVDAVESRKPNDLLLDREKAFEPLMEFLYNNG